jgi:hypothetical protein
LRSAAASRPSEPGQRKLYDKFGLILRIETTVNDVFFFKHCREVEHRDGRKETKYAAMQKTIYSLAANRRYLEFLSAIENHTTGTDKLNKISSGVEENGRFYRGFNFFEDEDQKLFESLLRGEFTHQRLPKQESSPPSSPQNRRPDVPASEAAAVHGLIRKIGRTYKYYVTPLGKALHHSTACPSSVELRFSCQNGKHSSIQVLRQIGAVAQ